MKKLIFIIIAILLVSVANAKDNLLNEEQSKEGHELVSNVQNLVHELKETRIGKISDIFVSLTTLIICIGAICVISTKTISAALKGEVIKLENLLMPFVFAIIISSYQPITKGVDWCVNGFDGMVAGLGEDALREVEQKRKEKAELISAIDAKKLEMSMKVRRSFIEALGDVVDGIVMALNEFKTWIVYYTVQLFTYCATFLTKMVGAVLCIIFYVIGPICIALSAVPAFSDNWKNWLAKYIWVQLFMPVARIISWILQEVEILILSKDVARLRYCYENMEATRGSIETQGGGFMEGTAYLGFMIVGGILFLCIPSIASWIVNTSGGGVMTGMNTAGTYLMTKTLKKGKEGLAQYPHLKRK